METAQLRRNKKMSRVRSVSEPSLQVVSGNFTRERLRKTDLDYERGKDKLAHWIGAWKFEEVCVLLRNLVSRCPISQTEYLFTVMESVPHRDFLYAASSHDARQLNSLDEGYFRPLSTPISRAITKKLKKSRYRENKGLHRANSITLLEESTIGSITRTGYTTDISLFESPLEESESELLLNRSFHEGVVTPKLPGLEYMSPPVFIPKPLTYISPTNHFVSMPLNEPNRDPRRKSFPCLNKPVSSRVLTPLRRHMTPSKSWTSPVRTTTTTTTTTATASHDSHHKHTKRATTVTDIGGGKSSKGGVSPFKTAASKSATSKFATGQTTRPTTTTTTTKGVDTGTTRPPTTTGVTHSNRPTTEQDVVSQSEDTRPTTGMSFLAETPEEWPQLSTEVLAFLSWFSGIEADWKQRELLEVVVWNLDDKELYFLAALIMNRRYQDFVTQLPEQLAIEILSYVPAKDLLSKHCMVSWGWNCRCSNEILWEIKTKQAQISLPMRHWFSWKQFYLDDLRLKKNWTKGRCVAKNLVGHKRKVTCICLNNYLAASGSADKTVRIWDLITFSCVTILEGHTDTVWSICFYGKSLVISASADSLIKIWNYRSGVCTKSLSYHTGPVWSIQQKKECLVSGGQDKLVCIWDLRKCKVSQGLQGHKGVVFAVEIDDSTQRVFSGSRDNTIRVWHGETGICLKVIKASQIDPVLALHWSKNHLVGCYGRRVTMWNTETWEVFSSFIAHDDRVDVVRLLPRDHHTSTSRPAGLLLTASQDSTVKYWDINSRRFKMLSGELDRVNCADFSQLYVVCGSCNKNVRVWDFHFHCNNRLTRQQTYRKLDKNNHFGNDS